KAQLLKIIVRLESSLEFVEDDLPGIEQEEICRALDKLRDDLQSLANTFSRGRLLHDGLKIAIVGRPNVGKSSLFNGLLGHGRAIVTAVPGTTRDTISESIALDGVPVRLIDTAGIRTTADEVESIGVERTRRTASDADLLVVVIDGSQSMNAEDKLAIAHAAGKPHVVALNKSDLENFSQTRLDRNSASGTTISVSAVTHEGLVDLRAAMLKPFVNG